MRKRIGIFVGEIAQQYQELVAHQIADRANSLGYDTVFICSYGSYNEDILYAEGEKSCINLPDCSHFSGIIVMEDVFDVAGMPDELYSILSEKATCPVVYLRTTRENCYSILLENKSSIETVVRHFTDVHGFTDICYMSGIKGMDDAAERLDGFMTVMNEKGFPVGEHTIFHGDYWRYKGEEAVDWFMEGRTTYPQAIVCANDYMAISVCEELRKRGVRVPQDVCVSGFDFIDDAKMNVPTLTSLEVDFEGMARRAVDIIDSVNNGNAEEYVQKISAKLCLNKSCGCGDQYKFKNVTNLIEALHRQMTDTKNSLISVTDYQDSFEFDEYMTIADKYRRFIRSPKAFLCFSDKDEKGYNEVENDSVFTQHMLLKRIFEGNDPAEKTDITFPRRKIIPDEFWSEDEPNNFCVFSIHFKNIVYGYLVAALPDEGWFDIFTQGYLMTLANAIENSEVHKQMEHLETIKAIYQKDALTGIYNRRGFDKLLQDKHTLFKNEGKPFALASIDMDNLKIINDTYGHAEGDHAIITLAACLSKVMKEGDFCARIGGDEFSAVLSINDPNRSMEFKNELKSELKKASMDIPDYNVDASIGICESTEQDALSLVSCVQTADKRMYEDKKARKMERKN